MEMLVNKPYNWFVNFRRYCFGEDEWFQQYFESLLLGRVRDWGVQVKSL